jgi:hypothetical protein
MHLDPNVEAAITEYISEGPLDKHGTAPDPTTDDPRPSNAGDLPGTHAEILAANDVLVRNAQLRSRRASTGPSGAGGGRLRPRARSR